MQLRRLQFELFALSVSLQATVSLVPIGYETKIAASHLLLPYFACLFLLSVKAGQRYPLSIDWRFVVVFFALALLLMINGVYVGQQHTGDVSAWGVRRVVATILMLGYFMIGVYIGSLSTKSKDVFALFFVFVAWTISALTYFSYLAYNFFDFTLPIFLYPLYPSYSRFQGLMDNPNAFGWISICALSFQVAFQKRVQEINPYLNVIGLAILISAIVLTASKSTWLGGAMAVSILLVLRRPAIWPLATATILAVLLVVIGSAVPAKGFSDSFIVYAVKHNVVTGSVDVRLEQIQLAFNLIREYPIWGIGLGSFPWEEARNGLKVWHYLHNSLLWLWTELGPLAVLLFVAFFALVVRALWPRSHSRGNGSFNHAVFALLWGFAAISVADEVLYQRYLWVFVGAALAITHAKDRFDAKDEDQGLRRI